MEKQKTDQSIIYHIYFTIPSANEEKKQKFVPEDPSQLENINLLGNSIIFEYIGDENERIL